MRNTFILLFVGFSSILWGQQSATIAIEDQHGGQLKQALHLLSDADGITVLKRKESYISFSFDSEEKRVAAMEILQSNSIEVRSTNNLQLDFPSLPANPSQEQLVVYAEQRQSWAANNPTRYKKFSLLPPQNQEQINAFTAKRNNQLIETGPEKVDAENGTKSNSRANYNNPGGTITTCDGIFYDTGGAGGNYSGSEYIITTFCPSTPGQCISIDFTMIEIEGGWDYLDIFNGPNTSAPYMGYLTGLGTASVYADGSNPSGCLTFLFTSDPYYNYAGWRGVISCIPCPEVTTADCIGGETICSDATLSGNSGGWGNAADLNLSNIGCLSTGENQTAWYLFSPATSGNIGFTLSPNTGIDYDFALWGPYPEGSTSADICSPTGPPIRCSYASGFSTNAATTSYNTGIGHPSYSPPQFASPYTTYSENEFGDGWVSGLTVTAGEVYVLVIDNFTANTTPFTMNWDLQNGATLDCAVLPVELLSFGGEHKKGQNVLSWKTASEQNADYFEVQRSDNGIDYQTLGTVPAQGNSSTVKDYSFIDNNPTRLHYYQLNQVDFNGSAKKYGPVAINLQGSGTSVLPAFPNPVVDNLLHIPFSLEMADEVTCQIINLTGQVLLQQTIELSAGNHEVELNLESMASGMYHLRITDKEQRQVYSGKVVK